MQARREVEAVRSIAGELETVRAKAAFELEGVVLECRLGRPPAYSAHPPVVAHDPPPPYSAR